MLCNAAHVTGDRQFVGRSVLFSGGRKTAATGWKSDRMNYLASLVEPFAQHTLAFLCIFTAVVFAHELGHYLVARWCGVRVEVFSIGFGREMFGWTDRHATRWRVSWLPFGGYIRMFGDGSAEGQASLVPGAPSGAPPGAPMDPALGSLSFAGKSVAARAAIVVAGPLANFVLAVIVLAILFATLGQQLTSTVVGKVYPDSAAAKAGILPGDKILALNGKRVARFEDIAGVVLLGLGEPLKVTVARNGATLDLEATPHVIEEADIFGTVHRIGRLGIESSGPGEIVHYDPATASWMAVAETYRRAADILKALEQIVTGVRPPQEVGGILSIAKMSGDIAGRGLIDAVDFAMLLSINLGLLNLFPIPLLDGGRLLFYAFEAVRGRPLGPRAEEWGFRLGFALVLSLMLFATWNDLMRFKVFH
jgi:regulator of sigma E protease